MVLTACGSTVPPSGRPSAFVSASGAASAVAATPTRGATLPSAEPSPTAQPNVYAAVGRGLAPALASLTPRVYVPDEHTGDVAIIDPSTFKVVGHLGTGVYPEHVTPDWDFSRLYVSNMSSSTLTVLDPANARATGVIHVPTPYDVYFSPNGAMAVVVNDYISPANLRLNGLWFYDRSTWRKIGWLEIPWPGADDLDFSADGTFLLVSCEYSGMVAKVDLRSRRVVASARVGGLPRDVRLAPDGRQFLVTNESLGGVSVVDASSLRITRFIRTGAGAHGLEFTHDGRQVYVNNRSAGTITVIDVDSWQVVATWKVGGSPDETVLSPDGSQLWISNRYHGGVSVVDTRTGKVVARIATGEDPHGILYWPLPGRYATGQNGNMR